ncbi:conserved hypothetical protein [Sphingorhabdus sp. 109]|nr:conserved hypothetical protein [Sphingorhabdus sp. 109]
MTTHVMTTVNMAKKPRNPLTNSPRKPRHDGWTEARKKTFLAVLRESGCVADACRVAGISTTSAYRLRRRDPAMAELWDAALADGLRGLVAVAHEHATIGKETVIYRGGAEVERRVAPSDSLMALLIKRGDLGGRIGSRTADQVITWEEWQDGVRFDAEGKKIDEREEAEQVRASLDRKLDAMRRGFLARDAREREAENARLHAAEERIRAAEQRAAELEARNAAGRGGRGEASERHSAS